ncbi:MULTISPECIES: RagB/SusD family nutrient uptake outer membrane protein [unclassified Saccharicrinis]|uniref:RagB/SusD family nutrient uptake outer membrane protein n=1 Tax=unclassified Saccharicrinis TaxID=2646859 RepID=UPI003D337A2D
MKIHIKILSVIILAAFTFSACQDLEMLEDTGISDELQWDNPSYVTRYVTNVISNMPTGYNNLEFGWALYANATDEAENSNPRHAVQNMNTGNWNSTTGFIDNIWNRHYQNIYKINHFLERTEPITYESYAPSKRSLYMKELEGYKVEMRFLRALFYYELIKHYGGVVLVGDAAVDSLEDVRNDAFKAGRSTFKNCAEYIISECDYIIDNELLPLLDEGADQGRPNGTAAKALKCKTQLLLASPVYNTAITEGSAEQMEYWKAVAATAEDIAFDRVFTFGPYDVFDGTSPEVILGYRHANSGNFEIRNYPIGSERKTPEFSGATNPSQNLVDAYRMKNGMSIDEPGSGYDPSNPYANRDDRLAQTILYNGSGWNERNVEPRTVDIYRGGRDGMDRPYGTRTGYYLKKFVDTGLDLRQQQGSNKEWPIFRFADIVLIWAEAVNEVWGPTDRGDSYLTATTILNQTIVRHGGLDELPLTGINKEELRERIREERFLELAFEGQRAWDLRRWGIAKDVLGAALYKMEVTMNTDGSFNYSKQKLEDRYFEERMNLYPIPQRDVNNGLEQNPGW